MLKFTFDFCLPGPETAKKPPPRKPNEVTPQQRRSRYKPTPPPTGDGCPVFHQEVYAAETPAEAVCAFRRDFPTAFAVRGVAESFTPTELAAIKQSKENFTE